MTASASSQGTDRPNPATLALRPVVRLTHEKAVQVRDLRRQHPGMSIEDIARKVGGDEEAVKLALSTLRTRRSTPRAVLNVSESARQFVLNQRQPGEPMHETVDRLLALVQRLVR